MAVSEQAAVFEPVSRSDYGTLTRWRVAILEFCRQKPLGAFGAAILIAIVAIAILAPLIAPYDYQEQNLVNALQGPSSDHVFGTDENGRDIFSRVVYGAQVTVLVGLGTVILTALLSGAIGIVSGYFGGVVDMVIQRFVDIWQSFPAIFLLLTLVTILGTAGNGVFGLGRGPDIGPNPNGGDWIWHAIPRTTVIILALGVILAGGASRVIRSSVLSIKANPYIEAARTTGANDWRIITRHILPNVFPVIIILSSLQLGVAVLAEATISFLGLGIPPPFPTWGQMLGRQARLLGVDHPYLVLVPGLAIFIAVYAFNMLGDALRDVLDPRLRGSR